MKDFGHAIDRQLDDGQRRFGMQMDAIGKRFWSDKIHKRIRNLLRFVACGLQTSSVILDGLLTCSWWGRLQLTCQIHLSNA